MPHTLGHLAELSGQGLQPFVTGPLGQDPATQASLAAFRQNIVPVLQNQAGLAGLGRSPALLDAIGQAGVSAQVPLIQQGLQNRLTASQLLQGQQQVDLSGLGLAAQLGNQEAQRQLSAAQAAGNLFLGQGANLFAPAAQLQGQQQQFGLQAIGQGGGLQQQTVQNLFNAQEQERLRRQALAESGSFGIFGASPSVFGQQVQEVSQSSGK